MLATIEITWGILGVAFVGGFACCGALSILVAIYFRATLKPRIKELEQENEACRANLKIYADAFEKMRVTPPQAERVPVPASGKT